MSELLKEIYSSSRWYAQRVKDDPDYWRKFSGTVINAYVGMVCQGRSIPLVEKVRMRPRDEVIPF